MSDATARAAHAQRLLDDPLLTELLDGIDREVLDAWKRTKVEEVEVREQLFQAVRANQRLRAALQSVVTEGAVVAARHAAAVRRAA